MFLIKNNKIVNCLASAFIFIYVLCINCNNIYASNIGNVFLSCDKTIVEKNEEFEVAINLKDNETVAFTSYLYFDNSKVDYISGPDNTNLIENCVIYVWHDSSGGDNAKKGELAKFKFKAKEEGLSNFIINGEFYGKKEQLIQTEFNHISVQIGKEETKLQKEFKEEQGTNTQSQNSSLKVLRLDKEGLVPNFESNIYQYYLTVPNEINDIEVLAIAENNNSIVNITGNTNLKEGVNTIIIEVISEDKTQNNKYNIEVTKTGNLELANTNLEILAIENILMYPQFDTNIIEYNAEISNEITQLNILAVPENENATVEIRGKDNLKEGNNIIDIIVTAQNGITKRVYKLNIYKRNQEEEVKYKEEVETNKEKLEEIYQIEKTENQPKNEINEENKSYKKLKTTTILVIVVIILIIIIYILKKKVSDKKY